MVPTGGHFPTTCWSSRIVQHGGGARQDYEISFRRSFRGGQPATKQQAETDLEARSGPPLIPGARALGGHYYIALHHVGHVVQGNVKGAFLALRRVLLAAAPSAMLKMADATAMVAVES